jgi:Cu-processing system ATP-binding protein
MIIATSVTKTFGRLKVLNNVSVTCNRGHTIALIGPNGSGKTTLIKTILGMVMPDSGFITFDQHNIIHDWKYRERIGYMPQIGRYPDNMSIAQVINMMKDIRKSTSALDEDLILDFDIKQIENKKMRTLSGGTRQKVSACLAFLFNPDVLILDEPTSGLDPVSSEILRKKIIAEKEKGKLILISSHILSELDDLVSEIIYMQDGEVRFHKSLEQLREDTGQVKLASAVVQYMKS